jgi:hypothetical protein
LAELVMTRRFLAGRHPGFGTMGIWLSQPGIDVSQAGPAANFILRSDMKYEQIVLSGTVLCAPGQTVSVMLPTDLVTQPYVMLHGNISTDVEYPSNLNAVGGTGANPNEIYFYTNINRNQLQFYNPNEQQNIGGFFMVFNRSFGT